MERSKQNKCVDGNTDNGVNDSFDNGDDGGNKHFTYLLPVVDCCLNERSKQNKYFNGGKENIVDNSDDVGDKHLTYLS
eukprot:11123143-Ditylum_brightwellii.AAC.1